MICSCGRMQCADGMDLCLYCEDEYSRRIKEAEVKTELFVDGAGRHVEVHERTDDCMTHQCCIHNPSDHALKDAPLVWRQAGIFDIKPSHMERICEHGVGHPDPDSLAFLRRTGQDDLAYGLSVHGCDGCCR